MQAVLTQINSVPGVVGSMMCDEDGRLAAQVFPQLFDLSMMEEAAGVLAESTLGLQSATGAVDLLDIRYGDARIIVRPMPQSFLFLLCTKTVNMQLLAISLNVAAKKLEKLFAAFRMQQIVPASPAPSPAGQSVVIPFSAAVAAGGREETGGVTLTVQAMKNTANNYWENMIEMLSLNRATSIQISDIYKTGSFKKLKLTNPANGRSRKFPVHIIKDDAEHIFDGRAVVSLASMETLGVAAGDPVLAEVVIGGGLFGWEGI